MATFRSATERDRAFCWHLHRQTMVTYVDATWGWSEIDQRRRFAESFDPGAIRIIEIDGEPIGSLKVDLDGTPVRILSIQICPAHQRKGHGTAVVSQVLRQAAQRPVWLQVLKVNPARALYERLGFVATADTGTHWQMVRQPSAGRSAG
jgi:ribosomal protein S18 acetylase RimI-like enzyme